MIKIVCPQCEQRIAAPEEAKGTVVECPTCHQNFEVFGDDVGAQPDPVVAHSKAGAPPLPVTPKVPDGSGTGFWVVAGIIALAVAAYSYQQSPARKIANDPKIREKMARAWTELERATDSEPTTSSNGTPKLLDRKTESSFADLSAQIHQVTTSKPIDTWGIRTVAGLKLEAPFPYKQLQDLTDTLSTNARARTEYLHLFDCDTPDMAFRAPVLRALFRANFDSNIDHYARGAMGTVIALTGARPEDATYTTMEVDGCEARRGSLRTIIAGGSPYHAEVLVIKRGQTVWEVRVLFPQDASADAAERLLKSIHIAEE